MRLSFDPSRSQPASDAQVVGVGYPEKGPYEAIHVGAAARTIPPALVEQLASPGRMVIPVGTYSQRLMQVDKDARGEITQKDLFGVVVRCAVLLVCSCDGELTLCLTVCAAYRQTKRCGVI